MRFTGLLEIWRARVEVVGEMPLRVGAGFARGAQHAKIVAFGHDGDRLDHIVIEERESDATIVVGRTVLGPGSDRMAPPFDEYFLLDRRTNDLVSFGWWPHRAVRLHSMRVGYRVLHLPVDPTWNDAVVVKVRVARDYAFRRPFVLEDRTSAQPEAQP